ncbi:hypothetical protein CSUI_003035 [Cystoisospora suis]|uniref:Transmembrane protein n=1 Tax=Cystoisospora suis TaxID=483139 RepID=A0A2C6L6J2_9APIC|nr:hypothetical protein CSUI_003035 [Cystoisospora suis]
MNERTLSHRCLHSCTGRRHGWPWIFLCFSLITFLPLLRGSWRGVRVALEFQTSSFQTPSKVSQTFPTIPRTPHTKRRRRRDSRLVSGLLIKRHLMERKIRLFSCLLC